LNYNRAITPAGLIASDAEDMSHYLIAQLKGGRYEGAQVLSPEGIAKLHQGTADVGGGISYAMGWVDSEMDGVPVVWHNGDPADFHATMILVPKSGWGVVLLMNGSNDLRTGNLDTPAYGVVARLMGVEPPPLGYLGYVSAVLLLVLYLGRLIILAPTSPVIVVPALLNGFVANPIFYVWLGLGLLRGRSST
jgi:CubicO group peptidase (beta-lactamase class C family)